MSDQEIINECKGQKRGKRGFSSINHEFVIATLSCSSFHGLLSLQDNGLIKQIKLLTIGTLIQKIRIPFMVIDSIFHKLSFIV